MGYRKKGNPISLHHIPGVYVQKIATKYARQSIKQSDNRTTKMWEPRSGRTGTQMDIKSLNENEYEKQARLIREGE
jgi:hypothetical protein